MDGKLPTHYQRISKTISFKQNKQDCTNSANRNYNFSSHGRTLYETSLKLSILGKSHWKQLPPPLPFSSLSLSLTLSLLLLSCTYPLPLPMALFHKSRHLTFSLSPSLPASSISGWQRWSLGGPGERPMVPARSDQSSRRVPSSRIIRSLHPSGRPQGMDHANLQRQDAQRK